MVRKDEKEAILAGKKDQELRGRKRLGGKGALTVSISLDPYTYEIRQVLESMKYGKFSELIRRLIRQKMEQIEEEQGLNERAYRQFGDILSLLLLAPSIEESEMKERAKELRGDIAILDASPSELHHRLRALSEIGLVAGASDRPWRLTAKGRKFLRKQIVAPRQKPDVKSLLLDHDLPTR
ncbi:MAG: hypothetical protein JRN14_00325 [Nitrososphaerota archaeon]|nr:hypothetical protein [Nitrososphaerota archaeon]MDG6948536.1 hypothetical protein [Nitrososphaerota archaeon]